jgi:PAS domain S-box-containing protein
MLANTTNTACITDGLYRILFDYAADSMFMLNREGLVKLVNKRVENILGYNTGDLRGKKLDFIILKPYRNIFNKALKESIQHEVDTVEIDVQTKTGKVLNMELDITGVKQNGKYLYTQVHLRDVSRRKKAEDEIRYLSDYLETILGNLECFVRVLNPKGDVLYVNKAYKKRFGREAGERCYSVWDKKLPCKDCIAEKAVKYFKSQRKEETLQTGEVYDTIAIPLKNRDGTVSVLEMITDITESRRLQQQETLINSIIRLAASDIDVRNVYRNLAEKLYDLIQIDRSAIITLKDDDSHIEIFSLWCGGRKTSVDVGIYPTKGTVTEDIVKSNKPILIEDVFKSKYWTIKKLAEEGIRTFLAIPLIYKERCIGAITFSSKKTKAFSERDINILESISSHLAITVANSNLYIQTKKAQEELKEINRSLEEKVRERTEYLEEYIRALDASLKIMEQFAQLELTEKKIYMLVARELLKTKPGDDKYSHMLVFFCKKDVPGIEGEMLFSKDGKIYSYSQAIEIKNFKRILNKDIRNTYYFNLSEKGKHRSKLPRFDKAIIEKVGEIRNGVLCKIKDVKGNPGMVMVFNTDREVGEYDAKILESYCIRDSAINNCS